MNRSRWLAASVALLIVVLAIFLAARDGEEENDAAEGPELQTFTGVITDIESSGLNEVSSFEVRHDDTTTTVFIREDFDYGFPIGHLQEHLSSGDPVAVEGELIDGKFYADAIEDA
ncbi:MAG TPA: hypothetical protein VG408_04775 [Actinomycetota bacterium]|nr:hypothetical protein [Actinomycetota bacterium]